MNIENYIKERVDPQQKWHSKEASKYKKRHLCLQTLILLLIASISILTYFFRTFPENDLIGNTLILISPIVTLLVALNSVYKSQELWVNYRQISEELKQHKFFFLTSSGLYSSTEKKHRESQFVVNIENIIHDGNLKWSLIEIEHQDKPIIAQYQNNKN